MSIKMKLVSCISAFILVLGIFIFGVLSAEQATVNLGGSISFDATDVYARVTGKVQNAQPNPTLDTLEFSAYNDTPDQSSWSGLDLQFDSRATDITIEVTVENLSMERELTVNLTDMIQTSTDNLDKSITLDNGAYVSGTNTTIPVATSKDENNTSKITFVITFDVLDHNRSLPSTTFDYDINLYDENSVPVVTYQPFQFEVIEGTENEVRITNHNGSGNVVIPATFSLGNTIPLTSFIMQDSNFSNLSMGQLTSLYLGELYYTETGGERTKTNMVEFFSMEETLTPPITVEPTYRYVFNGYSEINAMLLWNAIIAPSEIGYTDNINYYLTNDDFARQAFTTEKMMSYITENYPNAESDPTALAPLFATGTTILETDPIGSNAIIEGTDYVVTEIGDDAFESCSSLTSITIPEGVTSIGNWAFQACSNLTSITIPSSVTSIGGAAFRGCSSLTSITIPEGVTSIAWNAFDGCDSLTSIEVDPANTTYSSEDGVVFNKDKTTLIQYPKGNTRTSYIIPSSVTSIGDSAFEDCSGLTSITIPEGVTSIGDYAFSNCYALAEVYNYSSLTITAGSSSNDGDLGEYAKVVYNLNTEDSKPATRIKADNGIRYYDDGENAVVALYPLSKDITTVSLDNRTTEINRYAFSDCYNLTSITIPSSVTSIGGSAFRDCTSLTTINFGENSQLTSIGDFAFFRCSSLTTVDFGDNSQLTSIGDYAFQSCSSLTSITIPESVKSIGSYAFSSCSSLNEVTVESDDIYLALTSQSACGVLIYYVDAKGETVRVLKSVVDSLDPDFTFNTYLNGSNFTRKTSEDGRYYIYTHN